MSLDQELREATPMTRERDRERAAVLRDWYNAQPSRVKIDITLVCECVREQLQARDGGICTLSNIDILGLIVTAYDAKKRKA